jgi:hypothetical protein
VDASSDAVPSVQERTGGRRWAVFAPDGYGYACSSVFEPVSRERAVQGKGIRDREQALSWLKS